MWPQRLTLHWMKHCMYFLVWGSSGIATLAQINAINHEASASQADMNSKKDYMTRWCCYKHQHHWEQLFFGNLIENFNNCETLEILTPGLIVKVWWELLNPSVVLKERASWCVWFSENLCCSTVGVGGCACDSIKPYQFGQYWHEYDSGD